MVQLRDVDPMKEVTGGCKIVDNTVPVPFVACVPSLRVPKGSPVENKKVLSSGDVKKQLLVRVGAFVHAGSRNRDRRSRWNDSDPAESVRAIGTRNGAVVYVIVGKVRRQTQSSVDIPAKKEGSMISLAEVTDNFVEIFKVFIRTVWGSCAFAV